MIAGFDHLVVAVHDIAASVDACQTLLGREAGSVEKREGMHAAIVHCGNISVELLAPQGGDGPAKALRAALAEGEGLKSIAFATQDIERAHRRAERTGLSPEAIRAAHGGGRVFRLDKGKTLGLRLFVMEPARSASSSRQSGVLGMDHIVVRSPNLDAALALFGARLGLSLRLEANVAGRRLLMLRCGDSILEIAEDNTISHHLLWGVSWRVADAEATQARLHAAGLNVSHVRAGVKPGTRVFSVRDGTCGVPTLMIEHVNEAS